MPDDIFQQFHSLPQDMKNILTSPESLEAQEVLEEKYNVPLADLLMRVMVREVPFSSLPTYLREHEHLESGKADALIEELRENIIGKALPYLGGSAQTIVSQAASQAVRPTLANTAAPVKPQSAMPQTRSVQKVPSAPSLQSPQASPLPPVLPRPPAAALPSTQLRPTVPAQKAPYLIDAKDNEDIAQHEKKLATFTTTPSAVSAEERADVFIRQQRLTFASDVLAKRFRNVVLSCLHDVRDRSGTEEMLTKPVKIGGMEFDAESAGRIAAALEQEAASLHDAAQTLPSVPTPPKRQAETTPPTPTMVPPFVRDAARANTPPILQPKQVAASTLASVAQLQKQNAAPHGVSNALRPQAPAPIVPQKSPQQIPAPVQPPSPRRIAVPLPRQIPTQAGAQMRNVPVQTVTAPAPQQQERAVAPRQAMAQVGKQMVHDIRRPLRPMSAVDELADITVEDFRRLGDTLPDAAAKIVEKIHLLAEDSFAKRAEGIKAWRSSMVNQLYLSMGRESMTTGKTIDEIIQARERVHQPTLSSQEFALVADINRHLTA